jgi:hypothetical protein
MAALSNLKVFSDVVNDVVNTWYSEPRWNAALGAAENYFLDLKYSNVQGSGVKLTVLLETSDDGMNWATRANFAALSNTSISGSGVLSDTNSSTVGGLYSRFSFKLIGSGSVGTYIELWVTSRDAT